MKQQNVRNRLIENTIRVIAENGLDKTTTKAIVDGTNINEAYIYSYFKNKEDLLTKMFESLDTELFEKIMQHLPVVYMEDIEMEMRFRMFFFAVWKFLLGEKEKCMTYIRYYYSPYFLKNSAEDHLKRYMPILQDISAVFKAEADVRMIMHYVLNVMLDFVLKVHIGQMREDDDYEEHVFRVVYRAVEQYFKKKEVTNHG